MKVIILVVFIAVRALANVQEIILSDINFTGKLFRELSKDKSNTIFSPLSIHSILSMVYQGTSGKTSDQIRYSLMLEKSSASKGYSELLNSLKHNEKVNFEIANKIYISENYEVKKEFVENIESNFHSGLDYLNFSDKLSLGIINSWCENVTNGKIKQIVSADDVGDLTALVLLSAIYFKGKWLKPFDKSSTGKEEFFSGSESADVEMMKVRSKFLYGEIKELDAQVLEMKYQHKDFSFVVVLPRKNDGIKELENKIFDYSLYKLGKSLSFNEVFVTLPKFKIESTIRLKKHLNNVPISIL